MIQQNGGPRQGTLSLAQLVVMRHRTVTEVRRLEALLGKAFVRGRRARRGGLVVRNLEKREQYKVELRHHLNRLTAINAAIKTGRRAGNLMLLHGIVRPNNARELVAAMYRLFTDAVPPADQTDQERAIMQVARDYVATGVVR